MLLPDANKQHAIFLFPKRCSANAFFDESIKNMKRIEEASTNKKSEKTPR
jgi:hypothetical protein